MTLAGQKSRVGLFIFLFLGVLGLDQATKVIAIRTLGQFPGAIHSYCGDVFRLQFAENPGAFLGMGKHLTANQRFAILTVANSAAMFGLAILLFKRWGMLRANLVAGTLILGGGVGNLIDRLRNNGLVTDFMNAGIGTLRTGIFNVADMAIMAGCGILLCTWWREPTVSDTSPDAAVVESDRQADNAP